MAVGTSKSSTDTIRSPHWENWVALRPELRTPGYWRSLTDNCAQWASEADICLFWKEFENQRSAWSNEFYRETRGSLLARDELPRFCRKRHERIQTKIEQLTSWVGILPNFFIRTQFL